MGVVETSSLSSIEERIQHVMAVDDMAKGWLITGSPVPMLLILLLYGLVVTFGPRLMKNRQPFKVKGAMRVYNLLQVIHNTYMCLSIIQHPQSVTFIIERSCSTVSPEDETYAILYYQFLYYTWNYLVSKHIDLIDTVFMVLRKKNSHISFLHVYHHVAMVFFTWITLKENLSLHAVLPGILNTAVHSIMYSYYFLATFNRLKPFLWWKHHLTKLQLGQFVIILLYICSLYYYGCPISRPFTFTWAFNVFVILVLFINFYFKAYCNTKPEENTKQMANEKAKKSL